MSFWPACPSSEERGIDRRSVVRGAATALAGSALASAIRLQSAAAKASLPKVTIAPNRVIRQVAGLRPFRPSGFVVRAESLGDTIVIHNYGHGGCGVSLSWGTADLAVALAMQTAHRSATVIGCGAVGSPPPGFCRIAVFT
jgi:D-amino-acid oxidase